ncbi:MAG: hypothetical protein HQM13_15860 [SAR324 cluster bacterium]|nr:hypothetical protein [SAR324 cluster bacterium]
MQRRQTHFKPFYCYVETLTGQKVVTLQNVEKTEEMAYFYVAACPNEMIARTVYDRHLAIAQL